MVLWSLGATTTLVMPPATAQTSTAQPDHAPADAPAATEPRRECEAPRLKISPRLVDVDWPADLKPPMYLSAERMDGRVDQDLFLQGQAELRRAGQVVKADRLTYRALEDEVEAIGHVELWRQGNTFQGPRLKLRTETEQGFFLAPTYELQPQEVKQTTGITMPRAYRGRGRAERADFLGPEQVLLSAGTYSTCPPENQVWFIRSVRMLLDGVQGEGTAEGAALVWKNQTVLPLPTMSFPLSSERRSGFLAPGFLASSKSGLVLSAPYYLNLAPDYDLTLTPKWLLRRGLQMGSWFRYLGDATTVGDARLDVLPNDRLTGTNRYVFNAVHRQGFSNGLGLSWNLNAVSDDNYFADFGQSIAVASQRQLPRDVTLTYPQGANFWMAKFLDWQLLQDVNAPLLRPYSTLPQLSVNRVQADLNGIDVSYFGQLTQFIHPTLDQGKRLVSQVNAAMPLGSTAWFLTPKVGVHATNYQRDSLGSLSGTQQRYPNAGFGVLANNLGGQYDANTQSLSASPEHYTRVLPTFSVDAGAYFERPLNLAGREVTQTLEPRLFYVRTPYQDQSSLPVFDSARADLNFAQLFSENRFIGQDRIADVNQVTMALTSRLIDEKTGDEWLRLGVGQRFYIKPSRTYLPGETTQNEQSSDVLLNASGRLGRQMSLDATVQYGVESGRTQRSVVSWRYHPETGKALGLTYRYARNVLDQFDLAWQLPVTPRWYSLGRINFSLLSKSDTNNSPQGMVESLVGLEYNGDCWVFRGVLQRFATSGGSTNSSLFLQVELNGIGRLGTNPLEALRRNIPGYSLINSPTPAPSRFEDYQ